MDLYIAVSYPQELSFEIPWGLVAPKSVFGATWVQLYTFY